MELLNKVIENLNPSSRSTPHLANLLQKLSNDTQNNTSNSFLIKALEISANNLKIFRESPDESTSYLQYIKDTDEYISFLRTDNKIFSHQSDMISSVLPELFCQIFEKKLYALNVKDINVSGQEDLKIDFQILPEDGSSLTFKSKRVDVCVYKVLDMSINNENLKIPIPLISIENKVNLDKNMIYGIINTSSSVKKMYPKSKFFVYTEFSDLQLDKHNFAYSSINEVYTLRRQKRGSYRRTKIANPIHAPLIFDAIDALEDIIQDISNPNFTLEQKMYQFGKLVKT